MGIMNNDHISQTPVKYKFNRKAGSSIIDRRPVFSPDGESILIIVKNIVRVYNIKTGDCSRVLETEENVNELVGVQFTDSDHYNLYGCSSCGLLTAWTWENGAVLREIKLNFQEQLKVLTFDLIDNNECFITALQPDGKYLYLASHSLKTGDINYEYKATKVKYYEGLICVSLGWCNGDRYAAITNGTKCLFIQNLMQPHLRTEILNQNQLRITCIAAHPKESSVVIGDALGRVTILSGYLYNYSNLAREVKHWHHLPTMAVCFPKEGSYILSGGMEKVLVKWHATHLSHKAHEKDFIPRLPGMIRHIATDSNHIAISLTNNSVVLARVQMQVTGSVSECGGVAGRGAALCPLAPAALILSARAGQLQLYSTNTDKLLCHIDITQMNSIPPCRDNLMPLEMEVSCTGVSPDSSWLVTSEYRNDGLNYPEERLKFWRRNNRGGGPFKLNTVVNLSHGGCKVVAIALNSDGSFCVTAGNDQKFRVWKRETIIENNKRQTTSWGCLTACYYSSGIAASLEQGILNKFKVGNFTGFGHNEHSYMTQMKKDKDVIQKLFNVNKEAPLPDEEEDLPNIDCGMGGVTISQDGSLIAAWFGSKLTLWDTHHCNLRSCLSHPAMRSKGLQVLFGNNDAAHYVVCTTSECVAVWSLLSLSMKWIVYVKPSSLAAEPTTNRMAVITMDNDVFVFTPHSSTPIFRRNRLLDPSEGILLQCAFGDKSADHFRLYMMNKSSELYCLEPENTEEVNLEVLSRRNGPASNFSSMLAEQQLSEVKHNTPASLQHLDADGLGKTAILQFMSAAPHMMPPVSLLCTSFLEHIAGKEDKKDEEAEDVMEVDDDKSSDDDDEPSDSTEETKVQLWTPDYEAVKKKRLKKIVSEPIWDSGLTLAVFET